MFVPGFIYAVIFWFFCLCGNFFFFKFETCYCCHQYSLVILPAFFFCFSFYRLSDMSELSCFIVYICLVMFLCLV
jgi:hypothetical protein